MSKVFYTISGGLMMSIRRFPLFAIGLVIILAFVVNIFFPGIPGYIYLIAAFLCALLIVIINRKLIIKTKEIITDERIMKNAINAAYFTFRITFSISLIGGCIIIGLGLDNSILKIVGITLITISVFQSLLFTGLNKLFNARS